MHVNTDLALRTFANVVHDGHLRQRYIKLFLSRTQSGTLLSKVEHYQRQDDEVRERMNLPHPLNGKEH